MTSGIGLVSFECSALNDESLEPSDILDERTPICMGTKSCYARIIELSDDSVAVVSEWVS